MKQLNVGKDGEEGFSKELGAAYKILEKVWGKLVPKPMFLSESISGGVCFLGLQLGQDPKKGMMFPAGAMSSSV